jgi:hypothetical protein
LTQFLIGAGKWTTWRDRDCEMVRNIWRHYLDFCANLSFLTQPFDGTTVWKRATGSRSLLLDLPSTFLFSLLIFPPISPPANGFLTRYWLAGTGSFQHFPRLRFTLYSDSFSRFRHNKNILSSDILFNNVLSIGLRDAHELRLWAKEKESLWVSSAWISDHMSNLCFLCPLSNLWNDNLELKCLCLFPRGYVMAASAHPDHNSVLLCPSWILTADTQ